MLAKKYKLAKKDFSAIYKRGRRIGNNFFNFIYLLNRYNFSRFAVVISKKIAKLATQRNHTRRFVYQIIKDNPRQIPADMNIVIHCRQVINDKNKQQAIKNFLQMIRYLNEKIGTGNN